MSQNFLTLAVEVTIIICKLFGQTKPPCSFLCSCRLKNFYGSLMKLIIIIVCQQKLALGQIWSKWKTFDFSYAISSLIYFLTQHLPHDFTGQKGYREVLVTQSNITVNAQRKKKGKSNLKEVQTMLYLCYEP